MRQYGILKAILLSFYSKALYRDVVNNWGGKAFLYLLVIISISWFGATIKMADRFNELYKADSAMVVPQLPMLTISNGALKTPENRPYFIKAPATGVVFAIIDSSERYTDIQKTDAIILVTKNSIITRSDHDIRRYAFPVNWNKVIDPVWLNNKIMSLLNYLWIGFFMVLVLFSFTLRILQSLLYAILGKIIGFFATSPITYWQSLQLTMVALTPAILFSAVIDLVGIHYNHVHLMSFILTIIYLTFGVIANKST